jgi:hypothetical protein
LEQGTMRTSYRRHIVAAAFVGLFVISPMALHLPIDRVLWPLASWMLADENVVRVVVEKEGAAAPVVLLGGEASRAAAALCEGAFCDTARWGGGAAAEVSLLLDYEDGRTVRAEMRPDGRFAVTGMGGRFLLEAPELLRLLETQSLGER